jgi:uncharacterized protein DUF3592
MIYSSLLVGTLLALFGGVTLIVSVRDMVRATKSEAWPSVFGHVLKSEVQPPAGRSRDYGAMVEFRYTVGEREYTGDRIQFLWIDGSRAKAESTIARYPAGSKVEVRVSPQDPALAVLEPGVRKYAYASALIPAVSLAIGIVLILRAIL